jgi:hypothetical protein
MKLHQKQAIDALYNFLSIITHQTDQERVDFLKVIHKVHDRLDEDVIVESVISGIYNELREFMPTKELEKMFPPKDSEDFIPE